MTTTLKLGVPYITLIPETLLNEDPEKPNVTLETVGAVDMGVSYWKVKLAEPVKDPLCAAVRT